MVCCRSFCHEHGLILKRRSLEHSGWSRRSQQEKQNAGFRPFKLCRHSWSEDMYIVHAKKVTLMLPTTADQDAAVKDCVRYNHSA